MENVRIQKVNSEIAKYLNIIISQKLNDPRFSKLITINRVDTSNDLSVCKIFVNILADEQEQNNILNLLINSKGYIRRELAAKMSNLRKIPELVFNIDKGLENSLRVEELLKQIKSEENN